MAATIIGIAAIAAVFFMCWLYAQLAKECRRLKSHADKLQALCASIGPDERKFVALEIFGSVTVHKVSHGRMCIIKSFTDPDMDFNRQQAEELLEKLNEE